MSLTKYLGEKGKKSRLDYNLQVLVNAEVLLYQQVNDTVSVLRYKKRKQANYAKTSF